MAATPLVLPPMGPLVGMSFDRGLGLTLRAWKLFAIIAVIAILTGLINLFIGFFIVIAFSVYWYFASLANAVRMDRPDYKMTAAAVGRLILFGIVYGIAVELGTILFIVPGIYIATKWSLAPAIIVKEDASLGDALARSWALTDPTFWPTLGFQILASLAVLAVTYAGALIGYIVAAAIFVAMFHTMQAQLPAQASPVGYGGGLGAAIDLYMVIYVFAISYTYQARDVSIIKWYDGITQAEFLS